jgi:hypothetical protein
VGIVAELVRRALSKVRTPPDEAPARCAASGWRVHDRYGGEDDTTECPWCETRVRVVAHRRRSTQVRIVEHH